MNRGVEGFLHLTRGARKLQHRASFGCSHLESVGLQPCGDRLEIGIRRAVLLAVLFGRQPFVVVGRGFVLLIIEQLSERGLLLFAALQHK